MELSAGRPCSEWHAAWKAECERLQQDIERLQLQKSNVTKAIDMTRQKETPLPAHNSPTRSILADKSTNTASKRQTKKVTPRVKATKTRQLQPDFDKIPRPQRLSKGAPLRKTKVAEQVSQAPTKTHQLSPWEICYQVNLAFQKKITGPWQCVVCNSTGFAATPEYRSNFVMVVATCPDGHKDHLSSSSAARTNIACKRCDEDFALKLSQQTVKCFHPTCRRILVVDWELVRWAHAGEEWQGILKQYLELLEKNPKFHCVICQETLPLAESPGRTPTRKCTHQVNVCSSCLSGMLKFAVDTGNFKEIKCPAVATDKCKRVLHGKDVEALADRETYKKYDKFMMEELLRSDPTYRWCSNKTKDGICTWGQRHPLGDTAPHWECKKCNASNCFTCKTLWHHRLTCRQLELKRENDPASLKLLQQTTKKCPGCGHRIEKNRFCKDMICQKAVGGCGIEFCWACKVIYKPQKQHLEICPQKPYGATIASRPKMPSTVYQEDWDKDPGYIAPPDEYDMTGYGER